VDASEQNFCRSRERDCRPQPIGRDRDRSFCEERILGKTLYVFG